ncbi:MAG: hypothetical protein JST20_05390 [Bacteroidetes bacterium]|nr:hypothetical protein [Bacteroidota bacterium]
MKLNIIVLGVFLYLTAYCNLFSNIDPRYRKDCTPPCCVNAQTGMRNVCSEVPVYCIIACRVTCYATGTSQESFSNKCSEQIISGADCKITGENGGCTIPTDMCGPDACSIDICGQSSCIQTILNHYNQGYSDCHTESFLFRR